MSPGQVFGQDSVLSVTLKGQGTARRDRQERGTAARGELGKTGMSTWEISKNISLELFLQDSKKGE